MLLGGALKLQVELTRRPQHLTATQVGAESAYFKLLLILPRHSAHVVVLDLTGCPLPSASARAFSAALLFSNLKELRMDAEAAAAIFGDASLLEWDAENDLARSEIAESRSPEKTMARTVFRSRFAHVERVKLASFDLDSILAVLGCLPGVQSVHMIPTLVSRATAAKAKFRDLAGMKRLRHLTLGEAGATPSAAFLNPHWGSTAWAACLSSIELNNLSPEASALASTFAFIDRHAPSLQSLRLHFASEEPQPQYTEPSLSGL